ncbi:RNA-directed DNA polymerase (Reverse transcriptase), partial [Trifolium medium]|nr:RNA-directed DNA polymerase (Reverse transcriptase) [Trifolium medium]
ADRLGAIMPNIISKEQRGFIQGRQMKDCICVTSEAINLMHKKAYGGNLALKIDISKAFDTLDWGFLLKVLHAFGFNSTFCNWINTILNSARLSISVNGAQEGYFNCNRGVRQGDPLSPLLFCLAEDVLSRGISKLVHDGKLDLIRGTRLVNVPSHTLYADDIMVFCRGTNSNLHALSQLFSDYALASGQVINANKSVLFSGAMSQHRTAHFAHLLGFKIGSLPFLYLGVPIFRGKPKVAYLQSFVDKIRTKLSAWKASLLSIAGRVQLVKSVILSMIQHTIAIYCWPASLIKSLECSIRNFIWSGDVNKRKLVI